MAYLRYIFFVILGSVFITDALALSADPKLALNKQLHESGFERRFGEWLFEGGFQETAFSSVNPHYRISQGDRLQIQLWGGVEFSSVLTVDPRGNIFIPKIGPIKVLNTENAKLNDIVKKSISRVYKSNVEAYVSLQSTQKVKVFLSGMVVKPGLYEGQSADSILKFIDLAGGINSELGSYRHVLIKRLGIEKYNIDLYKYLTAGDVEPIQLQDGDVIFVRQKGAEVHVEGDVGFTGKFEIRDKNEHLTQILKSITLSDMATHVTVVQPDFSNKGKQVVANQFSINDINNVEVKAGAKVRVSSQLRSKSISVEVLGEHESAYELVLPVNSTMADIIDRIDFSSLSNREGIQLYRKSVAERQKSMLLSSLDVIEQRILTARSETKESAELRKVESESVLAWIKKARQVTPKGQIVLAKGYDPKKITLRQGDRIVIPKMNNLVMIHGEVLFPTTVTYRENYSIDDYLRLTGGTNFDLEELTLLVLKPNGSFNIISSDDSGDVELYPGDELLVLARPDDKSFQYAKDLMKVIYQVAVSAAVVLTL